MAIFDFIGYINTTSSATAAQKAKFLDDFCYGLGYVDTMQDTSGATIPNPETRTQFANRAILEWLKSVVKAQRSSVEYAKIQIEELTL